MNNTSQYASEDTASQEMQTKIRMQVERKYANLIRNAHIYLSYMYLITYNFVKSIYHGKILLRLAEEARTNGAADKSQKLPALSQVPPNSLYTMHCYIAEALCMLGKFQDSIEHLEMASEIAYENDGNCNVKDFE